MLHVPDYCESALILPSKRELLCRVLAEVHLLGFNILQVFDILEVHTMDLLAKRGSLSIHVINPYTLTDGVAAVLPLSSVSPSPA
jgi:hypothetical protein